MYTSLIAISIATCAMFVILSVFSGLESFNIRLFSDVNPDLKILPASGKLLNNIQKIEAVLKSEKDIQTFTKVIQEKVYVLYNDKDEIAYLKGVDSNFLNVVKIDTCFQAGKFPDPLREDEAAFGTALAYRLGMPIDNEAYSSLYMPKPGRGVLTIDNAFEKTQVHMTGIFALNDQYENYIFVPIQVSQKLLNLPPESAFSIEIKTKTRDVKSIQSRLKSELGNQYQVLTRQEQDASFLKMMKVEQLFIYLIFILVIIIASFNMAGAIIIIILDKKHQSKSLISLGYSRKGLKKLFFTIGIIITVSGVLLGIILGTVLTWLQADYSLVMANSFMPFPVKFDSYNYLIVISTVLFIGLLVSFLSSRKLTFK
ncbi:ABC transporter permease [Apibacter raozihei]|nr:FtsX-like permease family protein [Apibacter raozihei]